MYLSNSEIRRRARLALEKNPLGGKWFMLAMMGFVVSLILGAANYLCFGIGFILLCGPLYIGLYNVCLKVARGDNDIKFGTVFEGCYNFAPGLALGFMHTLIIALWSMLLIVPGIIKGYSYSLAYFIKSDHPEYSWRECLNESAYAMHGHKLRLFKLHLSFIGWYILSAVTLGFFSFWVNAYVNTATAIFYEDLKADEDDE